MSPTASCDRVQSNKVHNIKYIYFMSHILKSFFFFSLHQEVIAQRALDRRLTEELFSFKNALNTLTM